MTDAKDKRRFVVSVCAILGITCYLLCGLKHICKCGHMAHPPYAAYHYVNDVLWVVCFAGAGVFSVRSNLRLRMLLPPTLILLTISLLLLERTLRDLFVIELPLVVLVAAMGIVGLFSKSKDHPKEEEEQAARNVPARKTGRRRKKPQKKSGK